MKSSKPEIGPLCRVLLVDQDAAFASRLAQALEGPCGFRLCAHVQDVAAADAAVAEHKPELVVADTDPDRTGALPLLGRLAVSAPESRLLATSRRCDPAEAEQVLRGGAGGLLLKTDPAEEILIAFRSVIRGQIYVSRSLTIPLLKRLLSEPSTCPRSGVDSLTDRELRVFELLGFGLSKREVAARLGLSCKTVESHRAKIQHRLGLPSAAALAQFACAWAQRGLHGLPPGPNGSAVDERGLPQRALP
jgi:DNA-binding NarL/FixJ family response regulator